MSGTKSKLKIIMISINYNRYPGNKLPSGKQIVECLHAFKSEQLHLGTNDFPQSWYAFLRCSYPAEFFQEDAIFLASKQATNKLLEIVSDVAKNETPLAVDNRKTLSRKFQRIDSSIIISNYIKFYIIKLEIQDSPINDNNNSFVSNISSNQSAIDLTRYVEVQHQHNKCSIYQALIDNCPNEEKKKAHQTEYYEYLLSVKDK